MEFKEFYHGDGVLYGVTKDSTLWTHDGISWHKLDSRVEKHGFTVTAGDKTILLDARDELPYW